MTNRERAGHALEQIVDAIRAEVAQAGAEGLRNDEVARALGLETSVGDGQRNHLTHALLNRLARDRILVRDKRGARIYYIHSDYVQKGT